jgi:hypothetical protein
VVAGGGDDDVHGHGLCPGFAGHGFFGDARRYGGAAKLVRVMEREAKRGFKAVAPFAKSAKDAAPLRAKTSRHALRRGREEEHGAVRGCELARAGRDVEADGDAF